MNNLKVHNNYFLKKTNSKPNLKKSKNKPLQNKSNMKYNNLRKNKDILNDEINVKSAKFNDFQIIDNNSISSNNKESIPTTNNALDSDNSINSNIKRNDPEIYIKKLEKIIENKNKHISQLLEYKELCERRIKELSPNEILPLTIDSLNANFFSNRDKQNLKKSSKLLNTSLSNKFIKKNPNRNLKNYEKTIELNLNKTDDNYYNNKYNNLYKKYIKLYNDFKKINENDNNNIEMNKLKSNIYKLQNEYDNVLQKYNQIKKLNEELKLKIKNLEKNIEDNDDTRNAKKWKEQADILRKDLVLSQALVNSLKSEIESLNKKNKAIKRYNSFNNNRINKSLDYNVLPYNNNLDNNNNNNYGNNLNKIYRNKNYEGIGDPNISLVEENDFLKKSLSNKNLLISNMLEENNKLNNIIRSYSNNINSIKDNNNNNNLNNNNPNNENIEEMKKNLSQYENKFIYFNNYISNIKKQIFKLHQDLIQITNNIKTDNINNKDNNNNDNNEIILSENFDKKLKDIKDKLKDINIDFYNLDDSNDIKCIETNLELIKIMNEELNKLLSKIKNINFINKKEVNSIIDLFALSKALLKDQSLQKTLNDIFNITNNINKIYKQKYLNNEKNNNIIDEESNDLDKILITQEKELELIKKSLFDMINSNAHQNSNTNLNKRKTYFIINNYNNKKSTISNQFDDYNENINYNPNYTENYNPNRNYKNDNNNYMTNHNYFNGYDNDYLAKRYSNSRDKITKRNTIF